MVPCRGCYRPRPLPYALRGRVGAELDRLVAEGIIEPVESAEWASPLVVVDKKDGSIRLCADFQGDHQSACNY